MITRLTFASLAITILSLSTPVRGQELLLRYSFDDPDNHLADSGSLPTAPGTLILGGSTAGFVANTPSGTGYSFYTGDGNNNYITTGTTGNPDTLGDIAKLDGLGAFTLTLWVNLQEVAANDRLMSDGGAPSGGIGGFDFLIQGATSGTTSTSNFRLGLALNGTSIFASTAPDTLDQWVFLAVTYDSSLTSNNIAFYSGTVSSPAMQLGTFQTTTVSSITDNDRAFQVAGTTQTTSDRTPTGYFDDIRVYSGAADAAFIEGVRAQNIPEPSTAALLLCGIAGAGLRRWRRAEHPA